MSMQRRAFLLGASTLAAGATASASPTPGQTSSPVAADDGGGSLLLPEGGESRFARVNGVKLHYVRVGAGPSVILLHGWPQTWFAWRNTMARLCSRFTLIAPDLRGLGLSERTAAGYDKKP